MKEKGFFGKLVDRLKGGESESTIQLERRRAKREEISIPVKLTVGHRRIDGAKARNLSPIGLFVETNSVPPRGSTVKLVFESVNQDNLTIEVLGEVVWTSMPPDEGVGIQINRKMTDEVNLKHYRAMVLHYIRHPPLLESPQTGKFREIRCSRCDWIGRVSVVKPACPSCGSLDVKSLKE
ncbi:MAG: PilZ domain-containing protein [Deltaproteobacteria bacterium]|jgi:hypothetical protein|nr:PilZ domain-containing protein [Deltaproteobacteria bacterium]MBT6431481.1 PilZ domain-containing protein [Deltaproteobacteria bacterium]MBT6490459.1 PilZ domain-containing protein [Deltaproteobacteria bacterium]